MLIAQYLQSLFDVPRGTETLVKNISVKLADKHKVDLITGKSNKKIIHKNLKIFGYPYLKRDLLPKDIISSWKYVAECSSFFMSTASHFQKHRYDVVHIHLPINLIIKSAVTDPILLNFHGANPDYKPLLESIPVKSYCACSKYIASWAQKVVKKKVHVAYDGVDIDYFKPMKIEKKGNKTILLYLGALLLWKGFDTLLKAMKKVQDDNKNAELWIAGIGSDEEKIKSMIKQLKLKNVKLLGFVAQNEVVKLYNSCDAFISASQAEPFGLTFVEAMSCSKPIIAINNAGPSEIASKNTGFLAKPGSWQDLAKQISNACDSDLVTMGKNARERVIKNFSWDRTVLAYEKIYEKM